MNEGCDAAVATYCARFGTDCLVPHAATDGQPVGHEPDDNLLAFLKSL
jgi:hypothetical protein